MRYAGEQALLGFQQALDFLSLRFDRAFLLGNALRCRSHFARQDGGFALQHGRPPAHEQRNEDDGQNSPCEVSRLGCPPWRRDSEADFGWSVTPQAVLVGGAHLESIVAGREVGVGGRALIGARRDPVFLQPVEAVLVANLLRARIVQSGKLKRYAILKMLQLHWLCRAPVDGNLATLELHSSHNDVGWKRVAGDGCRVEQVEPLRATKDQATVFEFLGRTAVELIALQAIGRGKSPHFVRVGEVLGQTPIAADPERICIVQNGIDRAIGQVFERLRCCHCERRWIYTRQAA